MSDVTGLRVVPLVVLPLDSTIEALQPIVDRVVATIDAELSASSVVSLTFRRNGWTPEGLAWGRLLGALAESVAAGDISLRNVPK